MSNRLWTWIVVGAIIGLGLSSYFAGEAKSFEYNELAVLNEQTVYPSVQIDDNCSGTIINLIINADGSKTFQILTALHCMKNKPTLGEIHTVDIPIYVNELPVGEAKFKAKLIKIPKDDVDLALLEVTNANTSLDIKVAKVGTEDDVPRLRFGLDVFGVAFPGALSQTITEGLLGHRELGFGRQVFFQRATVASIGGSSGSGLFIDDQQGGYELIGTLTGGIGESFDFYTSLEDILKFLEPAPVLTIDPVFGE